MDVSIIIVNYKTLALILNCINSIIKYCEGINYEIIVVDNNSSDDFEKRISEMFGDSIICIPLSENIGFGQANNEGLKRAKGRNVLFLNPDTLLLNNAVKVLSDFLDTHPSVACCGGNLYDEKLEPMHSYSMLLPSLCWEFNLLSNGILEKIRWGKNAQFNHTMSPRKVGYICGADMMVKRDVLNQMNGFSKYFFLYYEDTELSYRINQAGYKIASVPSARIQHLEGKSMGGKSFNPARIKYIEISLSKFYALHATKLKQKFICLLRILRLNIKFHLLYKNLMGEKLYKECREIIYTNYLSK